jgi:preprotein translocase subunit SecA
VEAIERQRRASTRMKFQHAEAASVAESAAAPAAGPVSDPQTPFVRDERKVGRNEPCPCGSGKKYKRCHGRLA